MKGWTKEEKQAYFCKMAEQIDMRLAQQKDVVNTIEKP